MINLRAARGLQLRVCSTKSGNIRKEKDTFAFQEDLRKVK